MDPNAKEPSAVGWRRMVRRAGGIAGHLLAIAAFAGAGTGLTVALHGRAAERDAVERAAIPVPVATIVATPADGYGIIDRFVGRVEPARRARLAFERGGLVTAVLVEEGAVVAAGEAVAELDTAALRADRARLLAERDRVMADLELATLTEKRQSTLRERGHATVQALDEARLSRVALEAARASLEAAVARIDVDIDKAVVRAPFAGTVADRLADPGDVLAAGAPVAGLLETGRPQARVGVSPEAARALSPGTRVTLRAGGRTVTGRVASVRPDLSPATRTVPVVVDLAEAAVPFGDTVELAVRREVRERGFLVPVDALSEGERGLWTLLVLVPGDGDGEEEWRVGRESVEIVHAEGGLAFVRGTLREGQRVISSGRNRVVPGQLVALATDAAA